MSEKSVGGKRKENAALEGLDSRIAAELEPQAGKSSRSEDGKAPTPGRPSALDEASVHKRRFGVKLRIMGSSAGLFLALMVLGLVGFLFMPLEIVQHGSLVVLLPSAVALVLLAGAWLSRTRQYEHPSLLWYLTLGLAMLLSGAGWGPFVTNVMNAADPALQSVGLAVLIAEVLVGALLFAVDLTIVGLYFTGIIGSTAFLLALGEDLPPAPVLWLAGATLLAVPVLVWWSFRQQRTLVRSVAELGHLLPEYKSVSREVARQGEKIEDLARQKREVETELALTRDAAEAAGVAKTEFLATMSHEIRTPLNGIVPILEILRETPLNSEQSEFVTTALNSSHHLLGLINDILDYSKIEAGKLELETIEIQVEELIDGVVSLMKKSAERRGIRLSSKIARNAPKHVRGDPFRLRQVLTNLVGNAIKFTPKGSVSVEVSKHASSPKEVVLLFAVRDTGIGMSKDAVGQLFQLFSQADASTTRKYGGTGLGLVICKRLVELMGGRIGVKSEESEGSVFWFIVPMRKAFDEVPSARKSLQGARALLAGFDTLEQQRIVGYLGEWGMLSEQAASSVDALTKLKASAKLGPSWSYDALIVDAQTMGKGLGILVKDIRKIFELSELVILVVDAFPSVAPLIRDSGAGEVIPRPVQEVELRNRLCRLLDVQTYKSPQYSQAEDQHVLMPDAQFSWEDGRKDHGYVSWRTAPAPLAEPDAKQSVRAATGDRSPLVGHVLVAEDNPVNLAVVKKLLERFGLTCEAARDGAEALGLVRHQQYDVVLMDVQMPVMDGYQATRAIRERELERGLARMPILAMTANAMTGDREKCLDAGMDDYMSKPISASDLNNMLRQWLPMQEAVEPPLQLAEVAEAETPKTRAAPAEGSSSAVLSQDVLAELFEIMEGGTTALLEEYLRTAPESLESIRRAVAAADADALVMPAHSLKSSSANVGAMQVSELAKRLEMMGRQKNMENSEATSRQIADAFARAEQELRQVIERGHI